MECLFFFVSWGNYMDFYCHIILYCYCFFCLWQLWIILGIWALIRGVFYSTTSLGDRWPDQKSYQQKVVGMVVLLIDHDVRNAYCMGTYSKHLNLLVGCLEKVPKIFSQMVVFHGFLSLPWDRFRKQNHRKKTNKSKRNVMAYENPYKWVISCITQPTRVKWSKITQKKPVS